MGWKVRGIFLVSAVATGGCAHLNPAQPALAFGGRAVAIAVDPGGPSRMIAASESGGLFGTVDSGAHWRQLSGRSHFWFADVKILPWSGSVVVAAALADMRTVPGGGIWRSTDSGSTWSQVAITPPPTPVPDCQGRFGSSALEVEPGRNRVWAGTTCGLAYSDDSGASWLFQSTGPANDVIYAVAAPSASRQVILTNQGLKATSDGGATWATLATGLPGLAVDGTHNQIVVSPINPNHIFWATNYWTYDASGRGHAHYGLYASWTDGSPWTAIVDGPGINRPPFVRLGAHAGPTAAYDLYFSDGGCTLERTSVPSGATPAITAWTSLAMDHCDPADVAFDPTNPSVPVLLATDGGLHRTADVGASWTTVGGPAVGYAALQVTEVTGQLHADRNGDDLYFGTQDNSLWASADTGRTWTGSICCEGFFINVLREPHPRSETMVSGVQCTGCSNFISGALFAGAAGFPNAPGANGNPRLLKVDSYLESTSLSGLSANVFDVTTDRGATWAARYGVPEDIADLPKIAGPESDPVIYTAIRLPGMTPARQPIVGIKRVAGALQPGTPLTSNVAGIGSLGVFQTMFASYKPFGVDPRDPNYLLVPDVVEHQVKVSTDAGATWTPDLALTNRVTQGGTFLFDSGPFSQVSSFGFDPDHAGHILVGTIQAGVVESCDRGATWNAVADSDLIPEVSAFYFAGHDLVWISSYGRGLWTYSSTCSFPTLGPRPTLPVAEPTIYWKGARVPLSQIHDPDTCPVCGYFLVDGGDVAEATVDARSGEIVEARLSGGRINGFTWDARPLPTPFTVTRAQLDKQTERGGVIGSDATLARILQQGQHVVGLLVEGRRLKALILAAGELRKDQLPRKVPLGPRIVVQVPPPDGQVPGQRAPIVILGAGFDSKRPLRVTLDGRAVPVAEPTFDKDGMFTLRIPAGLRIGAHTILVEQTTEKGVIRDTASFVLPVEEASRRLH